MSTGTPPTPPKKKPRDVIDFFDVIEDEHHIGKRAAAGYHHLTTALGQSQGTMKKVRRKIGMPILRYSASGGSKAVEVEADLRKVPPEYLSYIVSPLCNLHAGEMREALVRIQTAAATAIQLVDQAMQAQADAQQGQEDYEEEQDFEEDDEDELEEEEDDEE